MTSESDKFNIDHQSLIGVDDSDELAWQVYAENMAERGRERRRILGEIARRTYPDCIAHLVRHG